jgi:uncharacterized membrane protein YbaN (DUF454 family)
MNLLFPQAGDTPQPASIRSSASLVETAGNGGATHATQSGVAEVIPFEVYNTNLMRPVFFVLGFCFFGLGAVGTVVPGLPTTPFMLLALWAFARSSQRFHDWLYHHKVFGPPLQQWQAHRVIPAKAKILAVTTMALSLIYLGFFTEVNAWVKVMTALVMLYGASFILTKPSRIPD